MTKNPGRLPCQRRGAADGLAVFTLIVVVGAEKLILRLSPSRAAAGSAEEPVVVDLR
jgi:hypothetical protein